MNKIDVLCRNRSSSVCDLIVSDPLGLLQAGLRLKSGVKLPCSMLNWTCDSWWIYWRSKLFYGSVEGRLMIVSKKQTKPVQRRSNNSCEEYAVLLPVFTMWLKEKLEQFKADYFNMRDRRGSVQERKWKYRSNIEPFTVRKERATKLKVHFNRLKKKVD